MAPAIPAVMTYSKEHLAVANKLRKPMVEKMRRDRINSSIEQLKSLLGTELLNQQPESRLEKADILEMTVCFLRRHLQQQSVRTSSCTVAVGEGYSQCVQEVKNFLSKDEEKTDVEKKLLRQLQSLQHPYDDRRSQDGVQLLTYTSMNTACKQKTPVNTSVWRPW